MAGSASNKVASKKGISTRPRLVSLRYPAAGAARRARCALVLARSVRDGVALNQRFTGDGAIIFKHACAPQRASVALRQASVESRFEAFHASGLTELVGREEELELLLRRWSKAKTGEGQVVLLSGEAGIGKSRLTAALLERLTTEPHMRLRNFCSPQHTDSAFILYRPDGGGCRTGARRQATMTGISSASRHDASRSAAIWRGPTGDPKKV